MLSDIGSHLIANGEVLVENSVPILVHAGEFGLTEGLETLQGLAKLPSITPIVPVGFHWYLRRRNNPT